MVLQETETQVQTALSDTILTTFQKTIKYQTEFSVEGLIRVVVDKKDIYTFNINERIEKGKEVERLLSASSDSKSPTKRKRGRPRKSQKLAESESDEDAFDDFPGEQEDDDEEDLDDSGAKVGDEKTDEQNIVKQEPLGFDMAGGDGSQKQAEAGSQVFSQEDTALQLQQLALQLAGVSSDLAMQQPEIPASSAATPGTATDPSQPGENTSDIWFHPMVDKLPETRKSGRKPGKAISKVVKAKSKRGRKAKPKSKSLKIKTTKKDYACSYCDKVFTRESAFEKHERIHTGEKPFQCSQCGAMFAREASLKKHETVHSGKKPYKCSYCDKTFAWAEQIKIHERTHTGERPYQCSFCGKQFVLGEHLRRHERLHTGERPYKCTFCDKCFVQEWHLKSHEKIHTGEKPYKCSFCSKKFIQHSNLKAHMRTHTGEKPYKCRFCEKAYADLKSKKKHESQLCQWKSYTAEYFSENRPDVSSQGNKSMQQLQQTRSRGQETKTNFLPENSFFENKTIYPFDSRVESNHLQFSFENKINDFIVTPSESVGHSFNTKEDISGNKLTYSDNPGIAHEQVRFTETSPPFMPNIGTVEAKTVQVHFKL